MGTTIALSLISHTNVGKTTLARTLLRRDVGEVLDQAHVTESSEAYELIREGDDRLVLWDTPGFGDTRRLLGRLRREREPLGWLLHQVWDRIADRPLFCSQRAVRNVREQADVVLYLVNAGERPQDAGYVPLELELLSWMNRPVLLVLNQIGDDPKTGEDAWSEWAETQPIVRGVLSLDAFHRCWTEEGILLGALVELVDADRSEAMSRLASAWNRRNLEVFRSCCGRIADYLAGVAGDRERVRSATDGNGREGVLGAVLELADTVRLNTVDDRKAVSTLNRRLDETTGELMARLIELHGLAGSSARTIEQRVREHRVRGGAPLSGRGGALAGAVLGGALSGLAADALSGGLSLGGGLIAGSILGAFSGSAVARGYRLLADDERTVTWTPEFIDDLLRQVLLRYMAVAHFGRGRGDYSDIEHPSHWHAALREALEPHGNALARLWSRAIDSGEEDRIRAEIAAIVEAVLRDVLCRTHPHASKVFSA